MPQYPFALQWSIAENELLALKDSVDGRLQSTSVLNIPDFEYYLRIYPNGNGDEHRERTWIFLHVRFKNVKKVEADRTFIIESANFSSKYQSIYKKSDEGWGPKICQTNELFDPEKKYIVDGKLTIKVEGMFKFEYEDVIPTATAEQEQKWNGGELGDEYWKDDEDKDFTIVVDGDKEIKVHKLFLRRSDVFKAMLKSNMKEAAENKMVITDFSLNVVEAAMQLIYTCNFTSTLSLDELMSLQQFLDKYNLPALKAKVEPLLIVQISASNVVRLTNCSVVANSTKLKEKCIELLSYLFASKSPVNDFEILDKDIAFDILQNLHCRIVKTVEK